MTSAPGLTAKCSFRDVWRPGPTLQNFAIGKFLQLANFVHLKTQSSNCTTTNEWDQLVQGNSMSNFNSVFPNCHAIVALLCNTSKMSIVHHTNCGSSVQVFLGDHHVTSTVVTGFQLGDVKKVIGQRTGIEFTVDAIPS